MHIDREYYSNLLRIALPITAQNILTSFLNVIGVTMLGQLGEVSIAAVGTANMVFFLLILMLFGTYSGVGVFTAQFWGKRDLANIRKVLGIGLIIGLTGSFLFTLLALIFPEIALRFYSTDPKVIATGSSYLRIVGWVYMVTAVTFAYSSVLRATGFVRVPMVVSVSALSLKTLLNYCLIFGNFGMPALGVEGAAISTVIARLIELAAILAITYWRKLPPAGRIAELLSFNREFLVKVLKTSLPVLINEMLWSLGITTYNMVYGRIGTEAFAAMNIATSIEGLAFVIFVGLSEATGIMIGNRIGAGDEGKAYGYARQTLMITTIGAVLIGLLLLFNIDFILSFYKLSDISRANAHNILTVMGCVFWIRISNLLVIVGVLRAGGDTRFCMLLDAGTVWLIGVPLALFCGFVLHLPVHLVYLIIVSEELIKYFIALWRFASRRWVNNLVQAV